MPTRAEPHHVARPSHTALLLVDVLQTFAGDDGRRLYDQNPGRAARDARAPSTRPCRPGTGHLCQRSEGRWHSSREEVIERACRARRADVARAASDACLRKLRVVVPRDTSRSLDSHRHDAAIELMATTMNVDTRPAASVLKRAGSR